MGGKISFSQFFMDSLRKGDSIYESWVSAKNELSNMESPFNLMNPQLVEGISTASNQTWIGGDFVVANLLPGWILGKVYKNNTGIPIEGATVNISVNDASAYWNINTMDDGYYLCEVPAGIYAIAITATGYEPVTLTDVSIGLAEVLTKNFGLVSNTDTDGDGVKDDIDAFPNNPSEWLDTDKDGIGNNADADDDNDGMPDTWEEEYGFNPLVKDGSGDLDNDGYTNLREYMQGTDPSDPDSYPITKPMPWLPLLLEE